VSDDVFAQFDLDELRWTLKMVTQVQVQGQFRQTNRADDFVGYVRQHGLAGRLYSYIEQTSVLYASKISPFNIEVILQDHYGNVSRDHENVYLGEEVIPLRDEIINYSDHMEYLSMRIPGATIYPYDHELALACRMAGAYTRVVLTNGQPKVEGAVIKPVSGLKNIPMAGHGLAEFLTQLKPAQQMAGESWMHWLYIEMTGRTEQFSRTVANRLGLPADMLEKKILVRTIPEPETVPKPPTDDITCHIMQLGLQSIRGKDADPYSASSYKMYGWDYGTNRTLALRLNGFAIFLDFVHSLLLKKNGLTEDDDLDPKQQIEVIYKSDNTNELAYAGVIAYKRQFKFIHYSPYSVNEKKGDPACAYEWEGRAVFNPNAVTVPFRNHLSETNRKDFIGTNL